MSSFGARDGRHKLAALRAVLYRGSNAASPCLTQPAHHESRHLAWRGLLRSFATLAAGEGAARVLGLVTVIVMARRLGPGGFGIAVLGTTLVGWFKLVMDVGTETLGVRDTSRTPHRFRALTEPILGLRLVLSAAAAGLLALTAFGVADTPADRQALMLFALVLPMIALNLRFMVLGVNAERAVALGNVASQAFLAAGALLLLGDRHDLSVVPLLVAAAEFLYAAVVIAAVVRRCGLVRPRIDLAVWRKTLRDGLPLGLGGLAAAARYSVGMLLIAAFLPSSDVGLYGGAYKPVLFFSTLVALFSVSFLSSYSGAGDGAERADLVRKTVALCVLVTVPTAILLSAGASMGIEALYGADYGGSAAPLAILAWSLPLLAIALPFGNVLIWADRQAAFMRNTIAGTLASVPGYAATIPLFGLVGAASTLVASLALVLALNFRSAVAYGLVQPLWGSPKENSAGARPIPTSTPSGSGPAA